MIEPFDDEDPSFSRKERHNEMDELLHDALNLHKDSADIAGLKLEAEAVGARAIKAMFGALNPNLALYQMRRRMLSHRRNEPITREWMARVTSGAWVEITPERSERFEARGSNVLDSENFDVIVLSAPSVLGESDGMIWAVKAARDINAAWECGR